MFLFKDAYLKSQELERLTAIRFGPFKTTELIGRNVVKPYLPYYMKVYLVIRASLAIS